MNDFKNPWEITGEMLKNPWESVNPSAAIKKQNDLIYNRGRKIDDSPVNILFTLELEAAIELRDTKNDNWTVITLFDRLPEVYATLDKYKSRIQNIALVHHGDRYNPKKSDKGIFLDTVLFELMFQAKQKFDATNKSLYNENGKKFVQNTVNSLSKPDSLINATNKDSVSVSQPISTIENETTCEPHKDYIKALFEYTKAKEDKNTTLSEIEAFMAMYVLLNGINKNGNYLSIACLESEADTKILDALSKISNQKINIYTNSNFTTIAKEIKPEYDYEGVKFRIDDYFGSILNVAITSNSQNHPQNSLGWSFFDNVSKKVITTNQDIRFNSCGPVFELVTLDQLFSDRDKHAMEFYSRTFKNLFIAKVKQKFKTYSNEDAKNVYAWYKKQKLDPHKFINPKAN